jgi:hypothetical protein
MENNNVGGSESGIENQKNMSDFDGVKLEI